MILNVRHVTRYLFDEPVRGIVQSQKLWPASCASQRVLSWAVTSEGCMRGAGFTDSAGDRVELASWRGPVSEIEIEVTALKRNRTASYGSSLAQSGRAD